MFRIGSFGREREPRHILCLGAHCDDIEIGCGGALLRLLHTEAVQSVTWVVFSSDAVREREARESAYAFLGDTKQVDVIVKSYPDGFLPFHGSEVKQDFETFKRTVSPDLVFTHFRDDRHQDHRLVSDLTWNTFRNHAILEYEIPKYDGDMGSPNVLVPLTESVCRQKISSILTSYKSQAAKPWFSEDVFLSLLRLRGMECNAPSGYAEGFYCRKVVIG
ncbi:MAG TPA: PIG-L deacetylase family protein [Methylomirabilota bacterium]|jgi:LmbE family N-acetylglucosaminyl deacetylase